MQNIIIGRCEKDPEAQGVIKPADERWQLVIDKDGFPHLYIQVNIRENGKLVKGLFCVEDMLIEQLSIRELMTQGEFGGELPPEDLDKAYEEMQSRKKEHGIPCPK